MNDAAARLRLLLSGYMVTQSISVVARLGVADAIDDAPRSADDLARTCGANADALRRVLRALAAIDVFVETADGRFGHSELSKLLRDDAKPSLRHLAIAFGSEIYATWARADAAVATGEPAFATVFGTKHFDWLAQNPAALETFTRAMAGSAAARFAALDAVDWSGVRHVVDVGGGNGAMLRALLDRRPSMTGCVFDLPEVVAQVEARDRLTTAAGSFLERDPPAADAYLLSRVLHDWSNEDAVRILERVRRAGGKGARLVVFDHVLRPPGQRDPAAFLDLQMLVVTGGRERTEPEWDALLRRAGFAPTSIRNEIVEGESLGES